MTELKSPEENPVHLSYNYNVLPTAEAAPQRFINGCGGDMEEAKKRWTMTRRWREAQGVNGIINEPQPNFFIIKDCCPEYLCGHGKNGNIVFYERPGDFNVTMLTEKGINAESLLRHWLFITEYQWEVLNKDPLAKAITVLDIGSVCISALVGKTLEVVKQTIKWANQHYPERSDVILIINSPGWVSLLWKMVRPWIDKRTQNKVRIFPRSETLDVSTIICYFVNYFRILFYSKSSNICCRV